MLAFAYIILAVALSSRDPPGSRPRMEKAVQAFGMAMVACATFSWLNLANSLTMLNEPIRRLAVNPRLAIISLPILRLAIRSCASRRHVGQSRPKPLGHGRRN